MMSAKFRNSVAFVLQQKKFDFNITIEEGVHFDVRAALTQDSIWTAHQVVDGPWSTMPQEFKDMLQAVHFTSAAFPMEYMHRFFDKYGDESPLQPWPGSARLSTRIQESSLITQIMTAIPLAASVFLFLSLALSPVRELAAAAETDDEKARADVPLRRFSMIAMPMIVIGYLLLVISLFMTFSTMIQVTRARSPSWEWTQGYKNSGMLVGVYPGFGLSLFGAFAALWVSRAVPKGVDAKREVHDTELN
jgi:hypothetical protein